MRACLLSEVKLAFLSPDCWSSQRRSAVNSRSRSRWHYGRVPHCLCHFHYLREAAKPIYAADRHAKKELKKHVRGVRAIERSVADNNDQVSQTVP